MTKTERRLLLAIALFLLNHGRSHGQLEAAVEAFMSKSSS